MPGRVSLAVPMVLVAVLACVGSEPNAKVPVAGAKARTTPAAAAARRFETMRIGTTDSVFDLALRGDSVVLSLSDHALALATSKLDSVRTDTARKSMLGAYLLKTVANAAQSVVGTTTGFAIGDLESADYANGEIVFALRNGKTPFIKLEHVKEHGRHVLASFSPADAQRFVAAVHAAQGNR